MVGDAKEDDDYMMMAMLGDSRSAARSPTNLSDCRSRRSGGRRAGGGRQPAGDAAGGRGEQAGGQVASRPTHTLIWMRGARQCATRCAKAQQVRNALRAQKIQNKSRNNFETSIKNANATLIRAEIHNKTQQKSMYLFCDNHSTAKMIRINIASAEMIRTAFSAQRISHTKI